MEQQKKIVLQLKQITEQLIVEGYRYFGVGGALGFDTLAAQCVLSLRLQYPHIRLILVIPCMTQTKKWSPAETALYEKIKYQADKVVCLAHSYTKACMFQRNRHLVNCSSVCVAYLKKMTGGTAYTVNYARTQGLRIINIAE